MCKLCNATTSHQEAQEVKSDKHYEHQERHRPTDASACLVPWAEGYRHLGLKTNLYLVSFRPFFYVMILLTFLPNYEKLSNSINISVILHYFVVI
jgi:hypothetical protein